MTKNSSATVRERDPRSEPDATVDLVSQNREAALELLGRRLRSARPEAAALGMLELSHDLTKEIDVLGLLLQQVPASALTAGQRRAVDDQLSALRAIVREAALPSGPSPLNLGELLCELLTGISLVHAGTVDVLIRGDGLVLGNAMLLRRALVNLLDNARRAAPEGRLWVTLTTGPDCVIVTVEDDGSGVDGSGVLDLTTSPGLGLAVVRDVAEEHDGHVSSHPSALGGVAVQLRLPRTLG